MKNRREIEIVVASPSDVRAERSALRDVVDELNDAIKDCVLKLLSWDTDAWPRFHVDGPQGVIDEDLKIDRADILIGIFSTRFGTPTPDGRTGTEHEIAIATMAWKESRGDRPWISLFFNKQPPPPQTLDAIDQWRRVLEFKASCDEKGLINEYESIEDFKRRAKGALVAFVRAKVQTETWSDAPAAPVAGWESRPLGGIPVHTFIGLQAEPVQTSVFQDFQVDQHRIENPNPVSYLWADAWGRNVISAAVNREEQPPHLRVCFVNNPRTYSSNIAIRPIGERAVLSKGKRYLSFEARVEEHVCDPAAAPLSPVLDEIFCGVRVVNGWLQHWAYGPRNRYRPLMITKAWRTHVIDLGSSEWWKFPADGNREYGPAEREFNLISLLILEFGSDSVDRPGEGQGTVLIRNCMLTPTPPAGAGLAGN